MIMSQARISRRSLISTGLATATLIPLARRSLASQQFSPTADQLHETIQTSPDRAQAIAALTEVFARAGIAVFDDAVTAPLVPPAQPVSPLSFQQWQLDAFVDELVSESHRSAEDLDVLVPTQTEAGDDVLSAGELLAGYYGGATRPGADFARAYLNRAITDTTNISAGELPFPTAIASLLGGEMLGQMYDSLGWASWHNPSSVAGGGAHTGVLAFT